MKTIAKIHQTLLTVITPLMAVSSITVALRSDAATVTSIAKIDLALDNFNQFPHEVGVINDVNAIVIAEEGFVDNQIDGDSIFFADDSIVFARSSFQTITQSIGPKVLGRNEISSTLIGKFLIPAQETLEFDLRASLLFLNSSENITTHDASTYSSIKISLQDQINEKIVNILNISNGLNTHPIPDLNQDFFNFKTHPNLTITNYAQQALLEENQESFELLLTASFQLSVEEDTEFTFITATQSCNSASDEINLCARVPEPSNRFTLLLGLYWLIGVVFWSRIMN